MDFGCCRDEDLAVGHDSTQMLRSLTAGQRRIEVTLIKLCSAHLAISEKQVADAEEFRQFSEAMDESEILNMFDVRRSDLSGPLVEMCVSQRRIASTVDDIQQELNNVSKLLRDSQRETPLSSERSEVEEDPAEVARREYMSNRRKSLSLASAAELATMSRPVKNDPPWKMARATMGGSRHTLTDLHVGPQEPPWRMSSGEHDDLPQPFKISSVFGEKTGSPHTCIFHQRSGKSVSSDRSFCTPLDFQTENNDRDHLSGQRLSSSWPGDVPIRDFLNASLTRKPFSASGVDRGTLMKQAITGNDYLPRGFCRYWPALDPLSPTLLVLDAFSVTVLMFDLTLIPYMLAWEVAIEGFFLWFSLFTCTFWSLDIMMNFSRGFQNHGESEMRPGKIVAHYLRTWFVLDISIVICDWLSISFIAASETAPTSLKLIRFAKVGRLLRVAGLLRMIRFAKTTEELLDRYIVEEVKVAFKTLSIFFAILWLTHIISCCWYFIGCCGPSDTGGRWLELPASSGDPPTFLKSNDVFKYVTAFHWAIAQITLGANDVDSTNTMERTFNILLLLLGLLFSATLVSSLSATMIDLQVQTHDKNEKLRLLRQYLRENQVDTTLAVRINKQAEHRIRKRAKLAPGDVEALMILSTSMQAELQFSICRRHIVFHPLFRAWSNLAPVAAQELCYQAVGFRYLQPMDDIFLSHEESQQAYFIIKGTMSYTQDPVPLMDDRVVTGISVPPTTIEPRSWLSEASLWSHWVHVGTAVARTKGQLMVVEAQGLAMALGKHRIVEDLTRAYGQHFHRRLIAAVPPKAPWPNDIEVPFTDFGEMVMSMDPDLQALLGMDALRQLRDGLWSFAKGNRSLETLEKEVEAGKSTVYVTGAGGIERVTSVIAFSIERDDERLFVQLGKQEGAKLMADCTLPGGKQLGGELPIKAADRILRTKLAPLDGNLAITSMERNVLLKPSLDLELHTKYLRTVCHSHLKEPFHCPSYFVNPIARSALTDLVGSDVPFDVENMEVYAFGEEKLTFYAWLTDQEFVALKSSDRHDTLSCWLSLLYRSSRGGFSPSHSDREIGTTFEDASGEPHTMCLDALDETTSESVLSL